jgi:membrane protease YdiL (CAAX protease family)
MTESTPTTPSSPPLAASAASAASPASGPRATYDHALRVAPAWWRGALAIVLLAVVFLVISLALGIAAVAVDLLTGAYSLDDLSSGAITLTPWSMLANNLALAAMWPVAVLLQWWLFGVRPRWMSSVQGRFRWGWLGRLALVIVPLWAVYVGFSFLLSPLDAVVIDGTVVAMLAVVVLTTPLQSAGEEFGTRGLIQRSAGSWFGNPTAAFVTGTIVSGAVFAIAHLAGDPWLIAYYFVFGASLSITARGTGGLEAPVLIHVTNNVLLLVPTALMSQTDEVFQRDAGTGGPFMLVPMAMCVLGAVVSTWWARRNHVVTSAPLPPSRFAPAPVPAAGPVPSAPIA